jgi:hypothetical protein
LRIANGLFVSWAAGPVTSILPSLYSLVGPPGSTLLTPN